MTDIISPYLKRPLRSLEEVIAEVEPGQPEPRPAGSAAAPGQAAGATDPEAAPPIAADR